jgi:hypothetical protein
MNGLGDSEPGTFHQLQSARSVGLGKLIGARHLQGRQDFQRISEGGNARGSRSGTSVASGLSVSKQMCETLGPLRID